MSMCILETDNETEVGLRQRVWRKVKGVKGCFDLAMYRECVVLEAVLCKDGGEQLQAQQVPRQTFKGPGTEMNEFGLAVCGYLHGKALLLEGSIRTKLSKKLS